MSLTKEPQPLPTFAATPESIIQDTKRLIEEARTVQRRILETVEPSSATFFNVLLPLAHSENTTALEAHILVFYRFVSSDQVIREASGTAQNLLDGFSVETAMNEGLFKLVDAAVKGHNPEQLDPESLYFLKKKHKNHVRNGLNLPMGPSRDRFKWIQDRLSQLTTDFRLNLSKGNGIWFSRNNLDGVPENILTRLERGQGDLEDKLQVTFTPSNYYPVMRYTKFEDTRRRLYLAYNNQCNQNIPIFKEAVVLRDEAARLLGYDNHAALRIEDKMARTPEAVNSFLGDIQSRLLEGGLQEVKELQALKQEDVKSNGGSFDGRFYLWDNSYYHRLMLEKHYSVDHQKIAEYFPVQSTIVGMLEIVQNLFGLHISKTSSPPGAEHTWGENVDVFSVWDTKDLGGSFLGYLYLDLFTRPGKTTNAANFNLVPGFTREDGTRQFPATALVCNFSRPSSENPTLLRHDEVVTIFHELGHGIHDLVAKTSYSCFHGTETVVDFGEAPSQMLEYWCWVPSQLKALSGHHLSLSAKQSERIPNDLVESLVKTKHVNGALHHLNQLCLCIFDMKVHTPVSHEEIETMNISSVFNKIRSDILPMDGPEKQGMGYEWGHNQAYFTHLLGEYDAGYYSYMFSKVYAADMFYSIFERNPMDSKEGIKYRLELLEKGGGQDEMETLTGFLGRKPEIGPFYKELGLE